MGPAEAIRDLAESPLAAAGLELWDVEVGADFLRILVDGPGGVDLDALSAASATLSPLLDERPDLVPPDAYQLEVSSPGVERTLRTPEHYRRYVGQPVSVKTTQPVAGSRRLHGTLHAVEADGILIALDDAKADAAALAVPYQVIDRAKTVLVWGPTPKTGKPSRKAAPKPAKAGRADAGLAEAGLAGAGSKPASAAPGEATASMPTPSPSSATSRSSAPSPSKDATP
ncbi:ribosome maturation factor RimP [Acidiferrimicrobium sp. IK]|uniref:ribosome maturation factor RimP n=1 Tax=Acidiferrimicrobium sp. IK TaxID=2871700 RepID=UPI0021CB1AD9|nr:ribosome maturation factor RimP [Acidiferrimicrobium sp. IK]MCU4183748.1 ribosome maturation factor RimP [Acidiferrimicrobium sp. IK]